MASSWATAATDARDMAFAVVLHSVFWKWPNGFPRNPLPDGVVALHSSRGPWIVERIVAVPGLGSDHSAQHKAKLTCQSFVGLGESAADRQHVKDCPSNMWTRSDELLLCQLGRTC